MSSSLKWGVDTEALFKRAEALAKLVDSQSRRPFVLELTGTPKSGKTTSIQMLRNFFKDAGWKVTVVQERAALCPLAMKGHFFFNTWTTTTMLAELLSATEQPDHLIILTGGSSTP